VRNVERKLEEAIRRKKGEEIEKKAEEAIKKTKQCPQCGKEVLVGFNLCPHCGFDWRPTLPSRPSYAPYVKKPFS